MKNQKDIYQALLEGKKIRHIHWGIRDVDYLILNKKGELVDNDGEKYSSSFFLPEKWHIVEPEPVKENILEMYENGRTFHPILKEIERRLKELENKVDGN